jgi:hypothetical protein
MPRDDVLRAAVAAVGPGRRGLDDTRPWPGRPYTSWQARERMAVALLLGIDQFAGTAATWQWDFSRERDLVDFLVLVEELETGGSGATRPVRRLPSCEQ